MSAEFLTPLRLEKIGPKRWILTDSLVFYSSKYRGKFIAPRGFQTDLASIPQLAQWLVSKVGPWDKAAVIHDAAYANALITASGDRIFCVKPVADDLFLEGMQAENWNGTRAKMMHRLVVLFGNPQGHPLAQNTAEAAELADAFAEVKHTVV